MVAPPGAGKGTQASRLARRHGLVHLASGELLRREVAAGTPLGRAAEAYLERGDLVPDELVLEMIREPVRRAAESGGFVLDGFPRTVRQAEMAESLEGYELDAVIHLAVSRAELRRRMLARAAQEGRSDDTKATIDHRLEVFDAETQPLLAYYDARGLLITIDGEQPVDTVTEAIERALQQIGAVASTPG
jgi:adenylate kinase